MGLSGVPVNGRVNGEVFELAETNGLTIILL